MVMIRDVVKEVGFFIGMVLKVLSMFEKVFVKNCFKVEVVIKKFKYKFNLFV